MSPPPKDPPRLVIEHVTPMLEGGRYPVKRIVGSMVDVGANIFKDGHDLVQARILYRHVPRSPAENVREREWRSAPLHYEYNPDRWYGSFRVDKLGRFQYTIEAWPDRYGSWRSDLQKRLEAGQDVRSELLEGADLLEKLSRHLPAESARRIREAATRIGDARLSLEERLKLALADEVMDAVCLPLLPGDATRFAPVLELVVDRVEAGFAAWYELFPRSQGRTPGVHGTFADTARRLPELAALGFDVIYLPPIHPIGVTHRKGRNNSPTAEPGDVGSPWAIGSAEGGHTAVHPALGTLDDFKALVRSASDFGIEIALDYALQCSPDHPWVKEHPGWFFVRPDGTLRYAENPPKKYEDIYPLNFWCEDRENLWKACRDVVLFWIDQGVRTFRVDNPHTKPFAFWEWLIADVQRAHPEVIFLSESFTRPNRMRALAKLGFTQSYTYFTWKNTRHELEEYLNELCHSAMVEYFRPNFFANTPDILHEYLQTGGRPAFRIRLILAATLSPVYGIYSGFELCENVPVRHGSEEYLNSEKYEIRVRDWNAPGNIKQDISKINRIRRENPALQQLANLNFLHSDFEGIIAYRKWAPGNEIIVAVNLDPFAAHESMIELPLAALGIGPNEPFEVADLLSGARYTWRGHRNYVRLDPTERIAHVFRVSRRG